ncbi:SusD/RagB family nutrient-binding outer membrane lipoprotein [Daejeonella oryzae]|uniref:SusD/RagB family nutrient-binding outer membrane lipoprotein n=1 Tax=Daejeonella oryzae TaxID=1122943 RepID=UPI00047E4CCA|nr:SusD/RagB family nutrient-binding outer membrane lipoprotein [Daejeonella oryzae]
MKKILGLLIGSVMLLSACDPSDFGDTNINPTAVSSVPNKALLTNSLQTLPGTAFPGTAGNRHSADMYVQHISEGPYPGASLYSFRNFDWALHYTGPLYNLKTIIDNATEGNALAEAGVNGSKDNQIAVARILKAYYFWWLTDRYGDIPYSEALKGDGNFSPKYDTQQSIYTDLFKELKEAAAQIKTAETGVKGDQLFDGDMAKWKMFANTTRLFMSLRLMKNDNAKGRAEMADALASGVISSNAENMYYRFLSNDPNNFNPWYDNYTVSLRNDYAISKTMTDYMAPKNDPRLRVYGEVLAGQVVGLTYGSNTATNIPGSFSRIGDKFRGAGSPALIYSYAQVLFTMAEAAKQGWIAGGDGVAATHYADAIKASFETYGVYDAATYATYMAQASVVYNPANGLERIMTQKWVHLYLNGYESWTDWRRTGFPVLAAAPNGNQPNIPRRMGYPTNEGSINGASYKEAVARQGADDLNTRMWWDK